MPIYEHYMETTPKLNTHMLTIRSPAPEETLMKQATLSWLLNPVFECVFNSQRNHQSPECFMPQFWIYMNHATTSTNDSDSHHRFPNLAKPGSDGMFCYHVHRRISCVISARCHAIGMSPNTATFIDFCFAVVASLCLYFHYYLASALLIQLFGIWSCVDGELARLSGKTSTLGDFYDTMVDRTAEFIIVAGVFFSFKAPPPAPFWDPLLFAYLGAVFLITNSSEKFRSAYYRNYPKKKVEQLFGWLCAGSDIRLLYLSIGLAWFAFTGNGVVLSSLILLMTVALYINFLFRLRKVFHLDKSISS